MSITTADINAAANASNLEGAELGLYKALLHESTRLAHRLEARDEAHKQAPAGWGKAQRDHFFRGFQREIDATCARIKRLRNMIDHGTPWG